MEYECLKKCVAISKREDMLFFFFLERTLKKCNHDLSVCKRRVGNIEFSESRIVVTEMRLQIFSEPQSS